MRLPPLLLMLGLQATLCLTATLALSLSLSKPGCPDICGNVTIPYPFGIGSSCSANSSFTVFCRNTTSPPTPFLTIINLEILEVFLEGAIIVNQHVSPLNCSPPDHSTLHTLPISLLGTPFTISARHNTFINLGCKNSVWLSTNRTTVCGCTPIFDAGSTDTICNGVNCCRITIPWRLKEFNYTYQSFQASNESFCGYAFPVDRKWLLQDYDYESHKKLQNNQSNPLDKDFRFAPLVLEWEADTPPSFYNCDDDIYNTYSDLEFISLDYDLISCYDSTGWMSYRSSAQEILHHKCKYASTARVCSCPFDEANPYVVDGACPSYRSLSSLTPDEDNFVKGIKKAAIIIGSVIGSLILLYGAWRSGQAIKEVIEAFRRYMFYKRNGGLLLEQHLASTDNGLDKTRLFTSKELSQATDYYNENRILGRGGQGTVYKGMLADGKIVAVKKSKRIDEGDLEVFINEVVILSQVNHRNVVRLLGCCLETEVSLLVYEFIPNCTLFHHIHEPNEELSLTWKMRVRIATEIGGALAYLHCASSAPIYHRDIKSTNILLDDKYRAKVSDFGTSRSVAIDQTHITTKVLGTFGYLDPEYFQSSQFTEKSDVYSFGVVMVELLTGEKAVTAIRAESGKSLATHFLHPMEENQLFSILDARVLIEGRSEEIVAVAQLARRCLDLNGKKRPTMKEVAIDLERIQRELNRDMTCVQHDDHSRDNHSIELCDESSDFSSISSSMHMDTITAHSLEVESPKFDEA